jgi:hypothetical protein
VSVLSLIDWFLSRSNKVIHIWHLAESGELAGHVLFKKKVHAVINRTSQRGNRPAKLATVYLETGEICVRASNFILPLFR